MRDRKIFVKKILIRFRRGSGKYWNLFKEIMQLQLSRFLSVIAIMRLFFIQDSGVRIGPRAKLFQEIIPSGGVGVELGVYKGTLSRYILKVNNPKKLHLVDPWWNFKPHWHWASGDTSTVRSLAAILLVLQRHIDAGQVHIHIAGSLEALSQFPDDYLDWAYIDSTHSYEQTLAELKMLTKKLKPSGIISGDDFDREGVYRAISEFLGENPDYINIYKEKTQFALTKKVDTNSQLA